MDTFLFRGTIWTFTLIHHVVYHMIGYGKYTGNGLSTVFQLPSYILFKLRLKDYCKLQVNH